MSIVKPSLYPHLTGAVISIWRQPIKPKLSFNLARSFRSFLRGVKRSTSLSNFEIHERLLGLANFTYHNRRFCLSPTHAKKARMAIKILEIAVSKEPSLLPQNDLAILDLIHEFFCELDSKPGYRISHQPEAVFPQIEAIIVAAAQNVCQDI